MIGECRGSKAQRARAPMKYVIKRLSATLVLASLALPMAGQENVTVPKSRLEELERKEKELEKLKVDLSTTKGENRQLKKQHEADAAKIARAPEPVVTHVSPPMQSLPPLTEGEKVD